MDKYNAVLLLLTIALAGGMAFGSIIYSAQRLQGIEQALWTITKQNTESAELVKEALGQ